MKKNDLQIKCSDCGSINELNSKHCTTCGFPFQSLQPITKVKCPECQELNDKNSKFCTNCGYTLKKVEPEIDKIKCPKCGVFNRSGSIFCAYCGKNLSGKHIKKKKKRKFASKLYKDSKGVIKSARSSGIRKTAKKETKHLFKGVDSLTDGRLSKTLDSHGKYGYLVCDTCNRYYELKRGVNHRDFKLCTCGGRLSYYKSRSFK